MAAEQGNGGPIMDKKRRLPREQAQNVDDGLPSDAVVDDTEAHVASLVPDELTVNPGTGGDLVPRRPSTGGEFIDENDVEGHAAVVPDQLTVNPGTGGDLTPRRPSTGGELIDQTDVEGR
jgi:hypothetical protein